MKGLLEAGAGFLVGVFTPGVLSKIKSVFVKETQAVETKVKTAVKNEAAKL